MDVAFETKLKFFEPDTESFSCICEICGRVFEVQNNQRNHQVRCKECQQEATELRYKNRGNMMNKNGIRTLGDPVLDLVYAVIRQAKDDVASGSREAREWLASPDGAELLCRCAGIKIDYDAERGLQRLAKK